MRGETFFVAKSYGLHNDSLALFIIIREMNESGPRIVNADAHIGVVEDFANLVTDSFIDTLDVKLSRESGLYAIDDSEFGVTLLGLLEQALGLVEETGVFERHAH